MLRGRRIRIDSSLKRSIIGFFLVIVSILLFAWISYGQNMDANHPELVWHTFETENFIIHYHDGAERTANVIARIAEEVHPQITELYQYKPDTKFHFIVRDTDDYANGAAYYYNNKMLIWCTALDFDLRGTTNWLRNVITHEYTHIIQLGAARKLPRSIPAFYVQVFDYEEEKRPDVLYGYPNVLTSYPFAMTNIPMWFAEGTAQWNVPGLKYDYWDSHRDMQLRVRTLNDSLLPLSEMEIFGKTSLGSESVYNHGFGFVKYIGETYGADKLREMTRDMKKIYRYDFNHAMKSVMGKDAEAIYTEWTNYMKENYTSRTTNIYEHPATGEIFEREGYANLYPMWSPDNSEIYFSSNAGEDYMSLRSIYSKPVDGSDEKTKHVKTVASPFDLTDDGKWIVYSEIVQQRNQSFYADIYLKNLETKKKVRLTRSARTMEPSFSPDEKSIVCVANHDGTKDIVKINLPDRDSWKKFEPLTADSLNFLTDFHDGTQCWRPKFSPDGNKIIYARGRDLGRDIVMMDIDGQNEEIVIGGAGDQRDPALSPDGNWVYYSSDETGIFNIYRYNLNTKTRQALTNVIGGAFMPNVNDLGQMVYSEFTEYGYEIRIMDNPEAVSEEYLEYNPDFIKSLPEITFDDTDIDSAETHSYKSPFEQLFFVPRIAWDYGQFKPGLYLFSSDFLEKLQLFAGGAINAKKEYDLFFLMDFKALHPTIFAEGFYISRKHDDRFDDRFIIDGEDEQGNPIYATYGVDYTYRLLEFDLGARMHVFPGFEVEARGVVSRYDAFQDYDDNTNFHYTYFKGKYAQVRFDWDGTVARVRGNVHPKSGTRAQLTLAYENNDFIDGFEINQERYTLQEVYTNWKYLRAETDMTTWFNPVGQLTVQPRLRGGFLSKQVDPFMHLYAGGLHGMRGYSYYSMGGTRKFIASLNARHPIYTSKRPKIGWLHFDGLWGSVFADVGDAWRERDLTMDDLKMDWGVELRSKFYSWYGFPTAVTLAAARSLRGHDVFENDELTHYDPDWKAYLTILFEFETIFPANPVARR